ncbi:MAG: 30S ribosomal protein S20 [Candidatus Niyogibacteria bacterium CG10_big_fil_rev_8_21_14_0_10_42_19]|uniref:Small ribosomal subunit protein bS20 n=1 Tax=Candidatus Niyogibacteria bacterium CG10_big_fil_rev_8_21_14_0_10_42_19 TaxID=1974725 RepID=A0A2H0TGM0_9BACT|nr:MAG: 30S ribosomal protein S20 [Candidatus Niyogibacteria bacterium CG10_big_fil_rev_8_21_14_0_10_42_19]
MKPPRTYIHDTSENKKALTSSKLSSTITDMPILRSAKKALRQSKRKQARNLKRKNELKNKVKEINKLMQAGKTEEAFKLIPLAYKALDKAAQKGVIKKNTASRKKSRLAIAINKNKK